MLQITDIAIERNAYHDAGLSAVEEVVTLKVRGTGLTTQQVKLLASMVSNKTPVRIHDRTAGMGAATKAIVTTSTDDIVVSSGHHSDKKWGRVKDQTIGPPWSYDEHHFQVDGVKHTTGGTVSVFKVNSADAITDDPLYYPIQEQAHAFGYFIVDMLNDHNVHIRDWRYVGRVPTQIMLGHLVSFIPEARIHPSLSWWQKLITHFK